MLFRIWVDLKKGCVRKHLVKKGTFELSVERGICVLWDKKWEGRGHSRQAEGISRVKSWRRETAIS